MSIALTPRGPGLASDEIIWLERELGVELPLSYAGFLCRCNGAVPEANMFRASDVTGSVTSLLGRAAEPIDDLEANRRAYAGRLPERTIPVALAAGGNLIVVNVDSGRVYFWDHEREAGLDEVAGNANMHLLADSFDEFMQSLAPFDSKTVVLDPAAVISVKLKPGFAEKFKAKP